VIILHIHTGYFHGHITLPPSPPPALAPPHALSSSPIQINGLLLCRMLLWFILVGASHFGAIVDSIFDGQSTLMPPIASR
jgi:hypothetical protein